MTAFYYPNPNLYHFLELHYIATTETIKEKDAHEKKKKEVGFK